MTWYAYNSQFSFALVNLSRHVHRPRLINKIWICYNCFHGMLFLNRLTEEHNVESFVSFREQFRLLFILYRGMVISLRFDSRCHFLLCISSEIQSRKQLEESNLNEISGLCPLIPLLQVMTRPFAVYSIKRLRVRKMTNYL